MHKTCKTVGFHASRPPAPHQNSCTADTQPRHAIRLRHLAHFVSRSFRSLLKCPPRLLLRGVCLVLPEEDAEKASSLRGVAPSVNPEESPIGYCKSPELWPSPVSLTFGMGFGEYARDHFACFFVCVFFKSVGSLVLNHFFFLSAELFSTSS